MKKEWLRSDHCFKFPSVLWHWQEWHPACKNPCRLSSKILCQNEWTKKTKGNWLPRFSWKMAVKTVLLVTTEHVESNAHTMFGCQLSVWMHLSMHHQKSSSDSPFHANTGYPASARAAATSFYTRTYRRVLQKGSTGITIRHYSLPLLMYVLYVNLLAINLFSATIENCSSFIQ